MVIPGHFSLVADPASAIVLVSRNHSQGVNHSWKSCEGPTDTGNRLRITFLADLMGETPLLFHLWRELLGILHILPNTDGARTGPDSIDRGVLIRVNR